MAKHETREPGITRVPATDLRRGHLSSSACGDRGFYNYRRFNRPPLTPTSRVWRTCRHVGYHSERMSDPKLDPKLARVFWFSHPQRCSFNSKFRVGILAADGP